MAVLAGTKEFEGGREIEMSASGCSLLAGIGQLHAMLGDAEAASEYCERALQAHRRPSAAAWDGRKGGTGGDGLDESER